MLQDLRQLSKAAKRGLLVYDDGSGKGRVHFLG